MYRVLLACCINAFMVWSRAARRRIHNALFGWKHAQPLAPSSISKRLQFGHPNSQTCIPIQSWTHAVRILHSMSRKPTHSAHCALVKCPYFGRICPVMQLLLIIPLLFVAYSFGGQTTTSPRLMTALTLLHLPVWHPCHIRASSSIKPQHQSPKHNNSTQSNMRMHSAIRA